MYKHYNIEFKIICLYTMSLRDFLNERARVFLDIPYNFTIFTQFNLVSNQKFQCLWVSTMFGCLDTFL